MLDRVIVLDNIKDEVDDLVNRLQSLDISVDVIIVGDDYTSLPVFTHNRQLIFMDLMLDENESNLPTNVSRIIQILNHIIGKGFGPYGLVVWTKHTNKMNEVLRRLTSVSGIPSNQNENAFSADDEEVLIESQLNNPPLFVIDIDKIQFKSTGNWDFSSLMDVLNQKVQSSNATYFFLRWLSVARLASQDAISSIYNLSNDYQLKEAEISHMLYKLAINYTGINHPYLGLTTDAYKAFSDILHPKISHLISSEKLPDFSSIDTSFRFQDEDAVLAQLNSIFFIDGVGIDQNEIVPGNVYQVLDEESPLIVKVEERVKLQKKKPNSDKLVGYYNYDSIPVAIELTPPCDFSNKKIASRLVGGYIVNYSANEGNKRLSNSDKNYILPPICIPGDKAVKYIVFDFRHLYTPADDQLKDPSKFKVLFRANHPLFSDILQKFSSHAARLGLKGLEPWK